MKAFTSLLLLASAALALSAATPEAAAAAAAAAECGNLGVMSIEAQDLPAGVTPDGVRKCAEHPLGNSRYLEEASLAPKSAGFDVSAVPDSGLGARAADVHSLDKKACYNDAPYGCTRGYCWKVCGPKGEWCWTAAKGGVGAWFKCSSYRNCGSTGWACGRGCPVSCGCSC